MIIDNHVHLERGAYTFHWLDQFIQVAQRRNVQEIGLVEHAYRFQEFAAPFEEVIQDHSRLGIFQREVLKRKVGVASLKSYLSFVKEAKERGYPVKAGLEICYFPGYEDETQQILKNLDLDFTLGSIHWVDGWGFDDPKSQFYWEGQDVQKIEEKYITLLMGAIQSGLFNVIAHIDSIKGFSPVKKSWVNHDVLKLMKKRDVALEVNTALKYRGFYSEICPEPEILKLAQTLGVDISLASDAHRPEDVGALIAEKSLPLLTEIGFSEIVSFTAGEKRKVSILS